MVGIKLERFVEDLGGRVRKLRDEKWGIFEWFGKY
jgi:hypothetical protein